MKTRIPVVLLVFALTLMFAQAPSGAAAGQAQAVAVPSAQTASSASSNYEKAIDLKILGLLANRPGGFELDRAPTRAEGLVMLLRLLGKEAEALGGSYSHPFRDVPRWADRYVGYAYQNGITNGKSSDTFGADDPLTANQYAALVLRAMGYRDGEDFRYEWALDKAATLGILSGAQAGELKNRTVFLRNDLVEISYNALTARLKGSSRTLVEKLVDTDRTVHRTAAELLGLYPSDFEKQYGNVLSFNPRRTGNGYVTRNADDLVRIITKSLLSYTASVQLDITHYSGDIAKDFASAFDRALDAAIKMSGVENIMKSWKVKYDHVSMKVTITYSGTAKEYELRKSKAADAFNKARHIVAERISADMSDFEKEKILHDYIVSNTSYDYTNYRRGTLPEDSFSEYGCLVLGKAVCSGYSKAMKLLCDLAGVECMIVAGWSNDNRNEGHSWNIVKIDGEFYHLDVTNDDAMTPDGTEVLTYNYFNITDSEMAKFYTWDKSLAPRCTSTISNYYSKLGLVAEDQEAMKKVLAEAIRKRSPVIEIKVADHSRLGYSDLRELIIASKAIMRYMYTVNAELGIIKLQDIEYFD